VQSVILWQQATIDITDEITILLIVRATYMWVLPFALIPLVVNRTFNATLTHRLQHLLQSWARVVEMTESERDK